MRARCVNLPMDGVTITLRIRGTATYNAVETMDRFLFFYGE